MSKENLDKVNQQNYFNILFGNINVEDFINDEGHKTRLRRAQTPLDIPDVAAAGGAPPAPDPGGPPVGGPPTPGGMDLPPMGGGMELPPMGGDIGGGGPPMPPMPPAPPTAVNAPPKKEEDSDQLKDIVDTIDDLKITMMDLKQDVKIKNLEEYVHTNIENLRAIITDLRDRKSPIREMQDTEGVYRDKLYGMVTEVLDKILPDLFEEIPEYAFLASQVSRQFEDGTVCDATVSVGITVPREGSRYDFKVEVIVLNGLIRYPEYIYRGIRIIPLTKESIQRELNSMSYRKMDVVDMPLEKENLYNNMGENLNRRPYNQKEYDTPFVKTNNTELPYQHTWHTKQKNPYR